MGDYYDRLKTGVLGMGQVKKGGLRHGSGQKRGVLGMGQARKRGGGPMHGSGKKGGGAFTAAHTCTGHICECPPPPPDHIQGQHTCQQLKGMAHV